MTIKDRISNLQRALDTLSVDFALVLDPENITYLTGYSSYYGGQNCVIVPREGEVTIVAGESEDVVLRSLRVGSVCPFTSFKTDVRIDHHDTLINSIARNLPKRASLAIEGNFASVLIEQKLKSILEPRSMQDIASILARQRVRKDEEEIARIRRAVKVAEVGIQTMLDKAKPGLSEIQLFSEMKRKMEEFAGEPIEVYGDLLSGEKLTTHGGPALADTKLLANGEDVLADMAPKVNGYWGDLARTKNLGSRNTRQADMYRAVKEAELFAISKVRPGVRAKEIESEVRRIFIEHGYKEPIVHATGHGIGLHFREDPFLAGWNENELQPGMVLAIEPRLRIKGVGFVTLEDDVLVTETGRESLSSLPFEL